MENTNVFIEQPSKSQKKRFGAKFPISYIVEASSFLFSTLSLSLSVYLLMTQPKVIVFDVRNTTNTFLEQVAQLNLTEQQKEAMIKRYENVVQQVISEYEISNHIVLAKNAVISKDDDRTAEIKAKIAARMKMAK